MGNKIRPVLLVTSIALFSILLFRNSGTIIKLVRAVPGQLEIGSRIEFVQTVVQKTLYQDDVYFGKNNMAGTLSANDGSVRVSQPTAVGVTLAPLPNGIKMDVYGRIASSGTNAGVSIGTTSNTSKLEVTGNTANAANLQGNVGIGNGVAAPFTVPLNVYDSNSTNLIKMTSGANTVNLGANASALTVDKALVSSGNGDSSFAGKVGIGSTSPAVSLDVAGGGRLNGIAVGSEPYGSLTYPYESIQLATGTNLRINFGSSQRAFFGNDGTALFAQGGGSVGIGTTVPGARLSVIDSGTGSVKTGEFLSGLTANGNTNYIRIGKSTSTDGGTFGYMFNGASSLAGTYIGDLNNTPQLFVNGSGSVGIGTTSPQYKLDVEGAVSALGSSVFAQNNNTSTSYSEAPIQIREAQYGASGSYLAPRLSFHWGGIAASQLGIKSDGTIQTLNDAGNAQGKFETAKLGVNGGPGNLVMYLNGALGTNYLGDYTAAWYNSTGTVNTSGGYYTEVTNLKVEQNAQRGAGTNWLYNSSAIKAINHGTGGGWYNSAVWGYTDATSNENIALRGTATTYNGYGLKVETTDTSNSYGAFINQGNSISGWSGNTGLIVGGRALGILENGLAGSSNAFVHPLTIGGWWITSGYMFEVLGESRFTGTLGLMQGDAYPAFFGRGCYNDSWTRLTTALNSCAGYHGLAIGPLWANGATRFDIAEVTPVDPSEHLIIGELVSPNETSGIQLHRSHVSYDSAVVGIVSDTNTASMTIGGDLDPAETPVAEDKRPIALGGRVTTIVNLQNGPIKAGDSIASSSTPGHGMKAAKAGSIVSKALESFDGSRTNSAGVEEIITRLTKELGAAKDSSTRQSLARTIAMLKSPLPQGTGRIITFISSGQYDPDLKLTGTGDLKIAEDGKGGFAAKRGTTLLDRIGAFAEVVTGTLRAGAIEVKRLLVDGVDILKELNSTKAQLKETRATVEAQGKQIQELKTELDSLRNSR